MVRGGLRDTKNQRNSHSVRVQSSYKFRRSDGRARRPTRYRSPSRAADHHLYRLHYFRSLPGSSNSDLPIISRTKGNHSMVNFTIDRKRNRAKTPFVSIEHFLSKEPLLSRHFVCCSRIEQPSTRISVCACWSRKFYSFAESDKRTRELSAVSSLDCCTSFFFAHSPGCSSKVSLEGSTILATHYRIVS